MKEVNDVRRRAAEPLTTSENPGSQTGNNPSKSSREEGELSSSDNDEFPVAEAAPFNREEAGHGASLFRSDEDVNAGRCLSTNNSKSFVELPSKTSALLNCQRSTQKNRAAFVPFVISFSDDDSGSECEEFRRSKASEFKGNAVGVKEDQKPPASSVPKSQMPQRTTRNVARVMPNRVSLTRTLASSLSKINGQNSRNGGRSTIEQKSRAINLSTSHRNLVGQEHGANQNLNSDSSKLQDLRQQIAIREKELKLRSVQQNKDNGSGSSRNYNVSDSEIDAPRRCRMVSVDFAQFEAKERDKKRLKLTEPHQIQQISHIHKHMPPVEPVSLSGKPVLVNGDKKSIRDHSHREERTPQASVQSGSTQQEKQEDARGDLSSGNQLTGVKKGIDSISNGNLYGMNKLVDPSISSEQTERVANTTAKFFLKEPAFVKDVSLCNCLGTMSISQYNNMDIESLFDIEEIQDKELEEAQEHRRECEMEERNALKAYRKAQRALIEANAKCSSLYQKRELCSAHLRSLMMENPSLLGSSRLQAGMNPLNYMPEDDERDLPTSGPQMQDDFNVHNEQDHGSNIQATEGALQIEHEQPDAGHVASDPCSEPDGSTSAFQKDDRVEDGMCSPSTDLTASTDEDDETFPFDDKSVHSDLHSQINEGSYGEREKATNDEPKSISSYDASQDSLLLEATLRSQLFARLGTKALSKKKGPTIDMEPDVVLGAKHGGDAGQAETTIGNVPFSVIEKSQHSASGGKDGAEKNTSQFPFQMKNDGHVENFSSNCVSPTADPSDSCFSSNGNQTSRSFTFSCPILRSIFGHLKGAKPVTIVGLKNRNQHSDSCDIYNDEGNNVGFAKSQRSNFRLNSMDDIPFYEAPMDIFSGKVGSYTCSVAIDPFWPLCVFELRGRCNNDECSWQHIKDYSCRNMNLENSESHDSQVEVSPCGEKSCIAKNTFKGLGSLELAPPTYIVCLDMMTADLHSHGSLLARSVRQCWQKCFSTSLVLSSMLLSDSPTEAPFLHGSDTRVEVHGSWNNQSLYLHNKKNQLDQQITDNDQVLEVALINLNHEANKRKGRIEALKVLARALEANSSCVNLWVAYLCIYYSSGNFVGEDDMFRFAVDLNQGSYELWLMFINTRMHLEDRLVAYNSAILALCSHASAADGDALHASSCILDLYLQFLNCCCNSGNVSGATEKIFKLFPSGKNSESHDLQFSNIIPCLTLSDKCIFSLCCVYFIVYKKLPDTIVQCFEYDKELHEIEWPSAYLTVDEKHRAVLLMEMAVDSLALYIDSGTLESEDALKAAHMFAVNHIRCITVLEGLEYSRKLLDKYTKIYPSCLELVLMSAKRKEDDFGNLSFVGFEEALCNWVEEDPGVQCIWNQYAEFALQNGRFDFAKELMSRWYHSVWQVQYSQYGSELDDETCTSNSSKIDVVFGLINLSLHKFFDNDLVEARLAIDRALKAASTENYKHCVKEHVSFLLANEDKPTWVLLLDVLKNYVVDPRAFSTFQPLSRKFIHSIKKPRVRHLVSNLWSDLSTDSSLVNLVLEVFYGPSLLPQSCSKLEDLVDMVEALLEVVPSNYRLSISVGNLLNRHFKIADVPSAGVSFWATSLIVNTLFQAVPIPPEYVWLEAADILRNLTDIHSVSESFHKKAISAYPFSVGLWKSYLNLSQVTGKTSSVMASAEERGIKLD